MDSRWILGALALYAVSALGQQDPADACAVTIAKLRNSGVHAVRYDDGHETIFARIAAWAKEPLPPNAIPIFVVTVVGLPNRGKTKLSADLKEKAEAALGNPLVIVPVHGMEDRDVEWTLRFIEQRKAVSPAKPPRFVVVVEVPSAPLPGLPRVHDRKSTKGFGKPTDLQVALIDPARDIADPDHLAQYQLVIVNENARPK